MQATQPSTLIIKAQFSWGGSKIIKTNESEAIGSVFTENGIIPITGTRLIFAFRGQLINPDFSFHHYGISSGSKIIVSFQKIPSNDKKRRFLESLERRENGRYFTVIKQTPDVNDIARKEEIARINDVMFMSLEGMTEFPLFMKEMLKNQNKQNTENWTVKINHPTVIPENKSINEDPLPYIKENEIFGKANTFKNEFGFTAGFKTDSLANNNGICEKKH